MTLIPYLEGDDRISVSCVVEPQAPQVDKQDQSVAIERTVISRSEKTISEAEEESESKGSQRAPTKEDQSTKRRRGESSSSESSNKQQRRK